jgi:hypothetical protein
MIVANTPDCTGRRPSSPEIGRRDPGANGRYRVCGELAAVGRVAVAFPAVCAAGAATAADTAAAEEEEKREKLSNFMAGMFPRFRAPRGADGR